MFPPRWASPQCMKARSAGFDSQPAWLAATFLKSSSDRHDEQIGYSARAGRSTGEIPVRCDPRFRMLSSIRTSYQVDQTPHTETFGDLAQLHGAGRKETAQQTIAAKPLHSGLPILGARTHPLEDPGQLRRGRRLSLAMEPARVLNQFDRAPQRKVLHHAFAVRIQPVTVFNRTEPKRLRSSPPPPSKNALRTQRDTQWYQRATDTSPNLARAITIGNLLGVRITVRHASRSDEIVFRTCCQKSPWRSVQAITTSNQPPAQPPG
jgi:hypothetical protein